jgi:hypothetical protein
LAISPWHIFWCQNARFYTLLSLFWNMSLLSFYVGLEKDDPAHVLASAVLWGLAIMAHETALLLLPIFILYYYLLRALPFDKPSGLRVRYLLPTLLLLPLGYGFYTAVRVLVYGGGSPLADLSGRFIGSVNRTPYSILNTTVYRVGVPLALLSLVAGVCSLIKRQRLGLLLCLSIAVPLGSIMILARFAYTAERYVFMSLPSRAILAAIALKHLSVQSRRRPGVTALVSLGILLLLLRDPAGEDVVYHLGRPTFVAFVLVLATWIPPVVLLLLARATLCNEHGRVAILPSHGGSSAIAQLCAQTERRIGQLIWVLGIALPLLAHPVLVDSLYFRYQHGWRDNAREAYAVIRDRRAEGDIVVSWQPELGTYYLGEEVQHLGGIDLETSLRQGRRIWFVEDWGAYTHSPEYKDWVGGNCVAVRSLGYYASGRDFMLRVHLCVPSGSVRRQAASLA